MEYEISEETPLSEYVLERIALDRTVELDESPMRIALAKIRLHTGRHHQIRVQMSNAGMPLLGDAKYGSEASQQISGYMEINNTALLADKLLLTHPVSREPMAFSIEYPEQWCREDT